MHLASIEMRMLLILLLSPCAILSVHMVMARVIRNQSRQIVAVEAALGGSIPVAAVLWAYVFRCIPASGNLWVAISYSGIVYGLLAMTYFHFFNMSETARRIRILYEIYRAGSLPLKDMEVLYRGSDIVSIRLERLVEMKQLRFADGYYSLQRKTIYLASLWVLYWRRMLGLHEN